MSKSTAGQNVCLALVCALCLATIGLSCFVLVRLKTRENSMQHQNIHLVVDSKAVNSCPANIAATRLQLPCFSSPNEYVSREGYMGPMKCKDDYFDEEGGANFCDTGADTFHLNSDKNAVVVQKSGIYRMYGQVSFKDKNAAPVVVMLKINSHNFIQCHQENLFSGADSAPYTTCTLSGERRLREGDRVALYMPQDFRTLNSYHKTTFWGLVRMAD